MSHRQRSRLRTPQWQRAVVGATAAALLVAGCGDSDSTGNDEGSGGGTVTLGATWPLSGQGAALLKPVTEGAQLAVDEVNASGGVLGKKFKVDFKDTRLEPQLSVQTMEQYGSNDVHFVSTSGSAVIPPQLPVAERNKIIVLNQLAQSAKLTGASPWLFNFIPASTAELNELAKLAVTERGFKKIAILSNNTALGEGDRDAFTTAVKSAGGAIARAETFTAGATDFSTPLLRIKDAAPAALYISGNPDEVALATKQVVQMGIKTQLLGRTQNADPTVVAEAGSAANGMIGVGNIFAPSADNKVGTDFSANFTSKFNAKATVYAALAYDSIKMLAQAMKDADSLDPTKVAEQLRTVKDFPGAMGSTTMGEGQTASYPLYRYTISGGAVQPLP